MNTRPLKTNLAINVFGAIIPLAVSLVTVPIYIHRIGNARYGMLSIVWVLLGYFGFLDLGLSRAAANAMSKLRDAPQPTRGRVLVTALVLNLGLGLFGGLCLFVFGGYFLQHVIAIPDVLEPEIAQAFPWIVGLFPLALVTGVGIGALESRERFLLANMLQMAGTSGGQIVPVILAVTVSPSLAVVIPAAATVRALTVIAILIAVYRAEGPLSLAAFDRHQANRLLSYGGWVTVSSVIGPLLTSLDQFLIASLAGVSALAHYAVPMNLVMRSQLFTSALTRTLFPRMSRSSPADAQRLAYRSLTALAYGYGAICAPAIILAPLFFRLWIGDDFAAFAAPVAEILFLGAWINALASVPFALLQSQGRPDVTGRFHAAELVPFIGILWGLTSVFGITGAASAWGLRCAADALLLFWGARMPIRGLSWALSPLSLLVVSLIVAHLIGSSPWEAVTASATMGLASAFLAYTMAQDFRILALTAIARMARLNAD